MDFLSKTAEIFTRLETDRAAVEKDAEKQLSTMLTDTHDASNHMQNVLQQLITEADLIAVQTTMFEDFSAAAERLIKASVDIEGRRAQYPARNKPELLETVRHDPENPGDGVTPKVAAQEALAHETVQIMNEQLATMHRALRDNQALQAEVRGDMKGKQASEKTDHAALKLKYRKNGEAKPQSQLIHDQWVDNINSLLQRVQDCLKQTAFERSTAVELRAQRAQLEIVAAWATMDIMRDKQADRRRQLRYLEGKIDRLRTHHDQLQALYQVMPEKEAHLTESLDKAEARLETRNKRPQQECKTDDAEESLVSEVEELKDMLDELSKHKARMEAEIQECVQATQGNGGGLNGMMQ